MMSSVGLEMGFYKKKASRVLLFLMYSKCSGWFLKVSRYVHFCGFALDFGVFSYITAIDRE